MADTNPNGAGRPTDLTDELFAKIKEAVFVGGTLGEIASRCGISTSTFYTWHSDNYLNIRDKVEGWRRDSKLELADINFDAILRLDPTDKDFTKPVLDASKFIKETLDKPNYSKRTEMTGADGKDLQITVVNYADHIAAPLHTTPVPTPPAEGNG